MDCHLDETYFMKLKNLDQFWSDSVLVSGMSCSAEMSQEIFLRGSVKEHIMCEYEAFLLPGLLLNLGNKLYVICSERQGGIQFHFMAHSNRCCSKTGMQGMAVLSAGSCLLTKAFLQLLGRTHDTVNSTRPSAIILYIFGFMSLCMVEKNVLLNFNWGAHFKIT